MIAHIHILMEKRNCSSQRWNKIAPWRFFTTKFSRNNCEPYVGIWRLISCQFHAMVILCEHSCDINTFRSLVSLTGYSLRLLSLKGSLGSGVWGNTFVGLSRSAGSLCEVSYFSLDASLWTIGRWYPASHCYSIWCIQEHCPVRVNTLLRHGNGARPGVSDDNVWCHRDKVFAPETHTYAVVFRLLVPHVEAFPGFMHSVLELCATVCGSMTFASTSRCVGLHCMLHHYFCQAQ